MKHYIYSIYLYSILITTFPRFNYAWLLVVVLGDSFIYLFFNFLKIISFFSLFVSILVGETWTQYFLFLSIFSVKYF